MEIEYQIIKANRRTLSVQITNDCKILVRVPKNSSETYVKEFLKSKRNWILKNLDKIQNQNQKAQKDGILSFEELNLLKKKAKKIIPQRVEYYAKISGIDYKKIIIRCQNTRWGSCSSKGNLNFNCLLVLMPQEILDSVVIHELCHRRYMNHSKEFYAEIDKYFPDYKFCDKWLKENGLSYLKRLPQK